MQCKKCNIDHDGTFGSGVFCSRSCANSRIWTEEINLIRSQKATGRISPMKGKKTLPCTEDRKQKLKEGWTLERKKSLSLKNLGSKRSDESKLKMSLSKKEFFKLNPEKHPNRKCAGKKSYWQNVLFEELKKTFPELQQEYKVDNIYLDIALPDYKINIEYDGIKWHDKTKDTIRDSNLIKNGWNIMRISSKDLNHKKRNDFPIFLEKCIIFIKSYTLL
jgi:very-short-patch-repair endonuclease